MAKLFFLFKDKRNSQNNNKFNFEFLSNYHNVQTITINEIIPGFYERFQGIFDLIKKIKQILNFRNNLISEKITHIFFCLAYGNLQSVFLIFTLRILLPKKIKVIYFYNSGFPDPKISFSSLRIFWYLIGRINNLIMLLLPQKNIFLVVNDSLIKKSRNLKNKLYLSFPHFDFDRYKNVIEKNDFLLEQKNIIFLDEMYTDHPDIKFTSTINIENQTNNYYKEVNKFLDDISRKFGKKVVIAKHPKHPYSLAKKRYNFPVSKKNTVDEITKAYCVVSHTSNSINMAIIFYKPIILLQTSAHKVSRLHIETLNEISKILSLPIIKSYNDYQINDKDFKISKIKFEKYIEKYITSSLSSKRTHELLNKYINEY